MKKGKKLSLDLNKKVISKFQASKITGGHTLDTQGSTGNHCMHTCQNDCNTYYPTTFDGSSFCKCK